MPDEQGRGSFGNGAAPLFSVGNGYNVIVVWLWQQECLHLICGNPNSCQVGARNTLPQIKANPVLFGEIGIALQHNGQN